MPKNNLLVLQKHTKHYRMIKKEKFMISMVCLLMNKKIMKTWDSTVIKEGSVIFQVLKILPIFGVEEVSNKQEDSNIFLEILKIFLILVNKDKEVEQLEEKISFCI